MNCSRLIQQCSCGGYGQPLVPWLTDEKQLVLTCLCLSCEAKFNAVYSIAELYRGCPPPNLKKINEAIGAEIAEIAEQNKERTDEIFLKQCGIIAFTAP